MFDIDYNIGETRLARNSRLCPTRELYFLHTQWGRHKSPYRKFRHMANMFRSAPLQRLIFPDLFCVATFAAGLTYYNEFVVSTNQMFATIGMSSTAFAGATTAIGLLAGFRLNQSSGRYIEGRKAWSDTQTALRELARQTMMWVNHDKEAQTRILRLCQAFPVTLLFHLNDKGCHHNMKRLSKLGDQQFYDRVQAEFEAELYDVYNQHKTESNNTDTGDSTKNKNADVYVEIDNDVLRDDFERLCGIKHQQGNVPLEVITCMAETIASVSNNNQTNPLYIREIDEKVQRLCKALGSSERLLKTPMPTGFTRHSSRLLFMWSNCLPFALYPLLGPIGTLPTSLLTSYAVLGIEDISVQLEEPFDILPLRQFSNTMYDSIKAIEVGFTQNEHSASTVRHNK